MSSKTTRRIVYAAVFTAISVVLKMYLGVPLNLFGTFLIDVNVSPVIVMMSGIVLGPLLGGIVGALTDVIVFLLRPLGGYIPLITLTYVMIGVIPALFFLRKKERVLTLPGSFLLTFIVQASCGGAMNTTWLVLLGFIPFDWTVIGTRLAGVAILWPVYAILLYLLIRYTRPIFNGNGNRSV